MRHERPFLQQAPSASVRPKALIHSRRASLAGFQSNAEDSHFPVGVPANAEPGFQGNVETMSAGGSRKEASDRLALRKVPKPQALVF